MYLFYCALTVVLFFKVNMTGLASHFLLLKMLHFLNESTRLIDNNSILEFHSYNAKTASQPSEHS